MSSGLLSLSTSIPVAGLQDLIILSQNYSVKIRAHIGLTGARSAELRGLSTALEFQSRR